MLMLLPLPAMRGVAVPVGVLLSDRLYHHDTGASFKYRCDQPNLYFVKQIKM
jgi:hypothetical protein